MKHLIYLLILMLFWSCDFPTSAGTDTIPISTTHTKSFIVDGNYEVTVFNLSDEDLSLWFKSPKGKTEFTLIANSTKKFGAEEQIRNHSTYEVGGEGYMPLTQTITEF